MDYKPVTGMRGMNTPAVLRQAQLDAIELDRRLGREINPEDLSIEKRARAELEEVEESLPRYAAMRCVADIECFLESAQPTGV